MLKTLFATLALALFISPAWAHTCPVLMQEIDQALNNESTVAQLDQDKLEEVRELRQQGETYHQEGDHEQSEEVLNEAKDLLGI